MASFAKAAGTIIIIIMAAHGTLAAQKLVEAQENERTSLADETLAIVIDCYL